MNGLRPVWQLIVYGRPGCHLCEIAQRDVLCAAVELGGTAELQVKNIEESDDLLKRFMIEIPVLVDVDGRVLARAPFGQPEVRRILRWQVRPIFPSPGPQAHEEVRP